MSVIGFILALPRKLVRGLVNRLALFAWWTGTWTNEGQPSVDFSMGNNLTRTISIVNIFIDRFSF